MYPVKHEAFLNRWLAHGPPCLRSEGQRLALRLPPDLPNRHFVDTITAMEWELHALGFSSEMAVDPCASLSPWSLYEVALKTGFHLPRLRSVPSWEEILSMTDAC